MSKEELEKENLMLREMVKYAEEQRDLLQPTRHCPYPSLWQTLRSWWEARNSADLYEKRIKITNRVGIFVRPPKAIK